MTVISGKGGTGKTSLVGSFAALARESAVLVDGDVDAANLSLITGPELLEEHEFKASKVAVIDPEKCNRCDLCRELCRFEAITGQFAVNAIDCEGCGLCAYACPCEAIEMVDKVSGYWFISNTAYGKLVHARLGIAEENSGKLVTTIRNRAQKIAAVEEKDYLLIDGPPGIGCPVIASLTGGDGVLIVTEPTVSGIHDLKRVLAVCRHFKVPAAVCVNRFDLDEKQARTIEDHCFAEGLVWAGKIGFDRNFIEAMIRGIPVVEYSSGRLNQQIEAVWEKFISS